ncbi:carboxypeptidase-like regulatory domain-containing protein [Flagellimonas sp. CMM7]|uniref:carboxypeptidase-like regulatory domain-containing protein n=1 Tax=Flagellimonas sp. CMM7 TaxID=2654676 RepID=UPI0013D85211|nr:carboxypeptidase-like regulatory domain-containing protein [Flagellimonas sp. CMM7]UII79629.1 carboxypeptidase-like regulatory domain-containing protein [Flagellimonas sp. CMM7]
MGGLRVVFLVFIFVFCNQLSGQITVEGSIIELSTGKPVDFANIGVVDRAKGTVSDFDGTFKFELDENEINQKDILQISRIGYKTLKFSTQAFIEMLKTDQAIGLEPVPYELEGVTVKSSDADKRKVGYQSRSKRLFGFWNDSLALGGEHASKILMRKGPLKLEDVSFNIIANISDSLLVRVNVYEFENGLPGKNISNGNILYTIRQRQGTIAIDLSPYNIVVDSHFVISLELLKIYGGRVGIGISAFDDGSRSYTRLLSQDRWKRMRKGFTIAFNLNTSAVEKEEKIVEVKAKLRDKPSNIMLLWDTSLSMKDRNLDKEFRFLDNYFKNLGDVQVDFQPMSYYLGERTSHKIANGDWGTLKKTIESTIYDGAIDHRLWEKLETSQQTLFFTDGKNFPVDATKDWYGTLFTINGDNTANHTLLKEIAEEHGGNYINLEKLDNMALAVQFTERYMVDNLEYTNRTVQKLSEVTGSVGDLDTPLQNVLVKVRDSDRQTRTNSRGNFSIKALNGEVLDFSYPGREATSTVVNTSARMLKIIMPLGITALDEVVLEENARLKELHKPINKNINTRFGVLDMNKVGFSVKQMEGSQISPSAQTLMDAVEGKFAGIDVVRKYPEDYEIVMYRRRPMSWDVDGHVYPADDPPFHINLQNIKDITLMPPAWSAARYGSLAPGGIIIVRTISNTFDGIEVTEDSKNKSQNVYSNDAIELANGLASKPLYAQRIANSPTVDKAYAQYVSDRKNYGHTPSFYFEASKIFDDHWNDPRKANRIKSNLLEQFPEQIDALKILAYAHEEEQQNQEALSIYKQIHAIKETPQAKRDLAKMLVEVGEYKEAWNMYKSYIGIQNILESKGLDQIVKEEMLDVLQGHGEEIGIDKSKFVFEEQSNYSLLVEWNDPNTQFELQFVNPQGQYYNWNNATEIANEKRLQGALSESFDIDDMQQGQWLINMTYLGNQVNLPTYLKFTLRNNQTNEEDVKMITLRQRNVKYKVMNLSNNGMLPY